MLYLVTDDRYIRHVFADRIWTEPDPDQYPAETAQVLRKWARDIAMLECTELPSAYLGKLAQEVACDFFCHTICPFLTGGYQESLFDEIKVNRDQWTREEVLRIARERIVALATLYARCKAEYTRRWTDVAFLTRLRGTMPAGPGHYDEERPDTETLNQLVNKYVLGTLVHFLFRPPVLSAYLPERDFGNFLKFLEDFCKRLRRVELERLPKLGDDAELGLLHNPNAPTTPPTAAAPRASDDGPVRAHDKGTRAPRWAGSRPRAGAGGLASPKAAAAGLPRDEGQKQASIEAGKARGRQLRNAEKERIAELWRRERIVSLGREIGGC